MNSGQATAWENLLRFSRSFVVSENGSAHFDSSHTGLHFHFGF
jgi:hypothetical protein